MPLLVIKLCNLLSNFDIGCMTLVYLEMQVPEEKGLHG